MFEVEVCGAEYRVLDWGDIDSLVDRLAGAVSRYEPSLVIGIQRGGAAVAHLITDRLGIRRLYAVGCESYSGVRSRKEPTVYQHLGVDSLKGHNVLVVDDVVDTGRSLRYVLGREVQPKKPVSVRTATLHLKAEASFVPDFYTDVCNAWIVYPWERYETAALLRRRLRGKKVKEVERIVAGAMDLPVEILRGKAGGNRRTCKP